MKRYLLLASLWLMLSYFSYIVPVYSRPEFPMSSNQENAPQTEPQVGSSSLEVPSSHVPPVGVKLTIKASQYVAVSMPMLFSQ